MTSDLARQQQQWLEARRVGLGASDAPVLLGLSPWKSALELYAEKIGVLPLATAATARQRWGHLLEGALREEYQRLTGFPVEYPGPYVITHHPDHPRLFASLDGIVLHPERGPGVLEIKTTGSRDYWTEGIPPMYRAQMQHEMMVTRLTWGVMIVMFILPWTYEVEIRPILEANAEEQAALLDVEIEFLRCVDERREPAIDGSTSARRALQALHPRDSGETILLAEGDELLEELDRVSAARRIAEEGEERIKSKVMQLMGDATFAKTPSGRMLSYKWQDRKEHVVKAASFRVLREVTKQRTPR